MNFASAFLVILLFFKEPMSILVLCFKKKKLKQENEGSCSFSPFQKKWRKPPGQPPDWELWGSCVEALCNQTNFLILIINKLDPSLVPGH